MISAPRRSTTVVKGRTNSKWNPLKRRKRLLPSLADRVDFVLLQRRPLRGAEVLTKVANSADHRDEQPDEKNKRNPRDERRHEPWHVVLRRPRRDADVLVEEALHLARPAGAVGGIERRHRIKPISGALAATSRPVLLAVSFNIHVTVDSIFRITSKYRRRVPIHG